MGEAASRLNSKGVCWGNCPGKEHSFFQRPATGLTWIIVRRGYLTATTEARIPLIEVWPAETCGSSETSDNRLECGDISPLCLSNAAILSVIVDKWRAIYFNFGCSQQKNRTSSPRPNDLKKKAVMNHRTPQVTCFPLCILQLRNPGCTPIFVSKFPRVQPDGTFRYRHVQSLRFTGFQSSIRMGLVDVCRSTRLTRKFVKQQT